MTIFDLLYNSHIITQDDDFEEQDSAVKELEEKVKSYMSEEELHDFEMLMHEYKCFYNDMRNKDNVNCFYMGLTIGNDYASFYQIVYIFNKKSRINFP